MFTEAQYISSQDGRKFLEEALRMREFDHPHILTLIGIALDKEGDMPLVVLPFMKHGDLLSYIRDETNVSAFWCCRHFSCQKTGQSGHLISYVFVLELWAIR